MSDEYKMGWNIATKIEADIQDRKGIGNEWDDLDEDMQEEIKSAWVGIIIKEKETTIASLREEVERLTYFSNAMNPCQHPSAQSASCSICGYPDPRKLIAHYRARVTELEAKVERQNELIDFYDAKLVKVLKIAVMRSKYPANMTNYYFEHIEEIEQILKETR